MGFEIYKESYSGGIKTIPIGSGEKVVTVGGETCYPFYTFEGDMPHKPKIAMEIWDITPGDWPESVLGCFKDVISDPPAWAKKCVEAYGAEMIALQLKSTDPNDQDSSPEDAAKTVQKVLEAINVPLIVWGTANVQKDERVLKKVAEVCQNANLVLGPVEDKNHKGIGASAMGFGHTVIASSPIDVNLAKQVNILLENLGVPVNRLIIDPTTGGLGYGLEYSYSVMERIRMAALTQSDDKLQLPIINNLGNEIWKCKEAKMTAEEAPILGDPERRGILMEAVSAIGYLMAGSNILIMRHPESIRMVKSFIDLALEGGSAGDVSAINKILPGMTIDYAALSPEPNLSIEEEKTKAAPAKKEKPAPAAKKEPEAAKPVAPIAVPKPAPEPKPQKEHTKSDTEAEMKANAVEEAKIKAELEVRLKGEAEEKARAESEAKAQAEAEEKEREKAEAKAREDAEAKSKAEALARTEAEEAALRQQRHKEREQRRVDKQTALKAASEMIPANRDKSVLNKLLDRLNRIHRRAA